MVSIASADFNNVQSVCLNSSVLLGLRKDMKQIISTKAEFQPKQTPRTTANPIPAYDTMDFEWSCMEDFDVETSQKSMSSSSQNTANVGNRSQPQANQYMGQMNASLLPNSFSQPNAGMSNQQNSTNRQMLFSLGQNNGSSSSTQRGDSQRSQMANVQITNGYNAPSRQTITMQQPGQSIMNSHYAKQIQGKQNPQQMMQQQLQQQLQSQQIMIQRQLQQQLQQSTLPNAPQQHANLQPQNMGYPQALFQQLQSGAQPSAQEGYFQQGPNQQMQQLQGWMSGNPFSHR